MLGSLLSFNNCIILCAAVSDYSSIIESNTIWIRFFFCRALKQNFVNYFNILIYNLMQKPDNKAEDVTFIFHQSLV